MKLLHLGTQKVNGVPDGEYRFAAAGSGLPRNEVLIASESVSFAASVVVEFASTRPRASSTPSSTT